MQFELQPSIENRWVRLEPLPAGDFDALYAVASDPLIWEQHPNQSRYQRDVFATYFQGAIESRGAFAVFDNVSGEVPTMCDRARPWKNWAACSSARWP